MNTLLLQPSDVLFFRDGRPMSGGLAGHGAAWPLPNVLDGAFHAALHRAVLESHSHRFVRNNGERGERERRFGALVTAGPFPAQVKNDNDPGLWFFPRPADAQFCGAYTRPDIVLRPAGPAEQWAFSSLPPPARYAVASTRSPTKETGPAINWLDAAAYHCYLHDGDTSLPRGETRTDQNIFLAEHTVGIGMDPATGAQNKEQIYSAHYLRLREDWRLGALASCPKNPHDGPNGIDLIQEWVSQRLPLVLGGQQRLCSVKHFTNVAGHLPRGLDAGFRSEQRLAEGNIKWLVKWVLLTPAIWPEIKAATKRKKDRRTGEESYVTIHAHPGGWLPNWVFLNWTPRDQKTGEERIDRKDQRNGKVLLTHGLGREKAERKGQQAGVEISARLVAALVPKPLVVTGWALGELATDSNDLDAAKPGAKSTHLAVPAGAVYYFEADTEQDAKNLARALNWHGNTAGTEIKNRRSTLAGEKGFGLGVCGTWTLHNAE